MDTEKAKNALSHLASRYRGETGYTVRDWPALQTCVQCITAALDEGRAALEKIDALEAQEANNATE